MKELFTNKHFILLLVVTLILLVMAALYTTERESVTFGEDLIASIITPMQSLFTNITDGITGFFGYFTDVDAIKEENKQKTEEIQKLKSTIRQLEQYKLENERLKRMLDLRETLADFELVGAEVIGKDPGSWYSSFTISKGTSDGLAVKQPVITSSGLVGHIYEIGTNWAKVISIIDVGSSVGAMVVRTRDVAVVESDVDLQQEGLCKLTYLSKNASLISGDIVETSGLGGIYPKGLLIGKIREVKPETAGISQYAIIEPAVDFQRISEVFVITNYPSR
ncbi:MAG: rod shape-determining protein MreC [Eubacteriales bacterium]|nr:rod shape-determining protein MreC [Eubacteriales bacterium]